MATSTPSPANMPKPGPRPGARPGAQPKAAPAQPGVVAMNTPVKSDPAKWGRIDEQGTVFVRTADGEREVGSWQAGTPEEGLAHFGARYEDRKSVV